MFSIHDAFLKRLRPTHPTTLAAVVAAGVEAASPAIAAGRHSLDVHGTDDPVWLHVDAARISQAITNLLNNTAHRGTCCAALINGRA